MDELRRIRYERGLSQQRLADLANVDKVTIVHIENGKVSPKVETLEKLADALGVELGDLFPKAQAPLFQELPDSAAEEERRYSEEGTFSVSDTDMLRVRLRDVPTGRLRNRIKALAGNQRAKSVEDLRTREGMDEATAQSLVMHRATEIRAELLRRNDEDPKDYLPDLEKYLHALDLP